MRTGNLQVFPRRSLIEFSDRHTEIFTFHIFAHIDTYASLKRSDSNLIRDYFCLLRIFFRFIVLQLFQQPVRFADPAFYDLRFFRFALQDLSDLKKR